MEILPPLASREPLELVDWLERRMAAHEIDLLHIHSTHFPAALGFFARTVPRLTSVWDFVYSKDSVSPLYHKVILDELLQGKLSEAVSFSSPVILEQWTRWGLPQDRGFWHSWGVDLEKFTPSRDNEKLSVLRNQLGVGLEEKMIFSPRTPSLPANHDLLLQALPRLEGADNMRCILTGHAFPPETRYMERLARKRGVRDKIRFVESIHDQEILSLYYQAADLVVSLHSNDHNPATVLEAMAVGGLVLINESPTVEYWIQDGRNGLVARTRDLNHLISKLNQGLGLAPETLAKWQHFNQAKIVAEANFHNTVDKVIHDYQKIQQTGPLSPCSVFHKGLLADICGQQEKAMRYYNRTHVKKEESRYLASLINEKRDLLSRTKGMSSFHVTRADENILALTHVPLEEWQARLEHLDYPDSLFRHDIIAGFYPLMINKRFDDVLYLVDLLAKRFHTDNRAWLSECVNWFGHRWSLWEACAGLLLAVEEGGSSLGCHALHAAKELGEVHDHYWPLLKKARDWTVESIEMINKRLDKIFRIAVHRESSLLLLEQEKAA